MGVNKVILLGNVGVDPTIRYVETRPVATFTLATTERAYTSASGAQIPERTEWHRIVMWDGAAETAENTYAKAPACISRGNCAQESGKTEIPSSAT